MPTVITMYDTVYHDLIEACMHTIRMHAYLLPSVYLQPILGNTHTCFWGPHTSIHKAATRAFKNQSRVMLPKTILYIVHIYCDSAGAIKRNTC